MKKQQIDSLQVLRAITFIEIFVCHTGIEGAQSLGACGVSLFIVLSGFLMIYNYYNQERITNVSFGDNLSFAIRKIYKLYPLHIATMLAMLVFSFLGERTESIFQVLFKLGMNIFLIQEWIPLANREINGMSWFLCEILFFYFTFPWILKSMEKRWNYRKARDCIVISVAFMIIVGLIGNSMINRGGGILTDSIGKWIIYYFPISRFIEFFIGCNVGYIYLTKENSNISSLFEALAYIVLIISNLVYLIYASPRIPRAGSMEKWWMLTLLFIPGSIMIITCFANDNAILPKIVKSSFLMLIGQLSPYAFLIHTVVFRYLSIFYYHLPGIDGDVFYYSYGRYINLTVGFALTLLLSWMWIKIERKLKILKRNQ